MSLDEETENVQDLIEFFSILLCSFKIQLLFAHERELSQRIYLPYIFSFAIFSNLDVVSFLVDFPLAIFTAYGGLSSRISPEPPLKLIFTISGDTVERRISNTSFTCTEINHAANQESHLKYPMPPRTYHQTNRELR
jgi:hypothetical protein